MKVVFGLVVVLSLSLIASARIAKSATTRPITSASASASIAPATTQAGEFPTPHELILKMQAMKKKQDNLPHVAMIDISKPLVERPADFSLFGDPDTATLRNIIDRLHQARNDKDIRAVLITLGPGSELSFAQAQEVREAISAINRTGKKTFVYADAFDTPTYTLASSAQHICMLEGGEIMIPGVGLETMFMKGLFDKVGVKADYVQIGEYKGADEEYTRTSASDELKGELNRLTNSLYEQIVDGISLYRNLPKQDVRAIVDDAMITAEAAKSRGLVDDLVDQDGLRDLISTELSAKKIEIVHDYGKPERETPDMSNPFALLAAMAHKPEPTGKPEIAIIYLDGMIVDGEGGQGVFGGSACGSDQMRKAIRTALRDDNIKAVVLRINSPGGSALASEAIWQSARHLATKKPLLVSIGHMAASGGYYVASSSETIYADPAAIVGSIGVVGGKFVTQDLYAKLGLTTETFSKGRNANLFSSAEPWDDRQRKLVTQWMKTTYDQFIERILTTRSQAIKHIDDVARGRIFSAKEGKDLGLVDQIGGLEDAIAAAARKVDLGEGAYELRVLPSPKTLADYFAGGGEDAANPFQPKITIAPDSLLNALGGASRQLLGQQLQSIELLQRHPVLLVAPYVVTIH